MNCNSKQKLYNEDCLDFLSKIKDNSIDLVIVDPPYYKIVKNQWDNQWRTEKDYLEWCQKWTKECFRVLKNNKCFYVWGTTKTDTFLRYKLEVLNSIENAFYQNWIIWSYDWGGRTKKSFPRKHEDLLMYSKGKTFPFYPDEIRIPYKIKTNVRSTAQNNPLGKIPTDVWEKNNHTKSKEYCGWHPTQKPISLLERIIKAHTKENEIVLDCFSGSGATMKACKKTNRNFIGTEINEFYWKQSQE